MLMILQQKQNHLDKIKGEDFSKLENKTFAIRESFYDENSLIEAKDVARPIWERLKSPKVDLKNPDFRYLSLTNNKELYFCEEIYYSDKEYQKGQKLT